MARWHDDDSFWETFGPAMFTEREMAAAPDDVERIISLTGISAEAGVLDLCCGVGRHSLEFARRGYAVTSVDRTAAYLRRAGDAAGEQQLRIEFCQADIREFRRPGAFDLVVNLYTSFGYFEDPEEDRRAIVNVFESLRPGGVLVMELMGKEVLARIFLPRDWQEHEDFIVMQERYVCDGWDWMHNRWIMFREGQRSEVEIGHRLYSACELKALLGQCGFADAQAYGSLAGDPYDGDAKRLVVVGRKP